MAGVLWQEKYRPLELVDYIDIDVYKPLIDKWWRPFGTFYQDTNDYKARLQHHKLKTAGKKARTLPKSLAQEPLKITSKPFLVLYGEPGTGKTTLAHCIFKLYNMDVIEINSSDARNKKLLAESINTGKKSVIYDGEDTKDIGIIMDELDGLSTGDMGGASTLVEITTLSVLDNGMVHAKFPVICTTNSIKEKKLKPIMDLAVIIHITPPGPDKLLKLAEKINTLEQLGLTGSELAQLAEICPADFRKLIEYLNRCQFAKCRHNELNNILLEIRDSVGSLQLTRVANLPIQNILAHIISLPVSEPNKFSKELDVLVDGDAQQFYYNLLDNYAGVLDQLSCQDLTALKIASNFTTTVPMVTWTGQHKDWALQPYINYIGPVAGLKILNRAYSNSTGLTSGVTTGYHTKYNTFRSDTGYFNNNVVSLDTNIPFTQNSTHTIPFTLNSKPTSSDMEHITFTKGLGEREFIGMPVTLHRDTNPVHTVPTSRQPKYNYYTGLLTGDIELLMMSRTNQALKHIVVTNTKHTNNIIKKTTNMLA